MKTYPKIRVFFIPWDLLMVKRMSEDWLDDFRYYGFMPQKLEAEPDDFEKIAYRIASRLWNEINEINEEAGRQGQLYQDDKVQEYEWKRRVSELVKTEFENNHLRHLATKK